MYLEHQPQIRAFALQSPRHTATVVMFAVASIRERFTRMLRHMRDIAAKGDQASVLANAGKRQAYHWLRDPKNTETVFAMVHGDLSTVDRVHGLAYTIPNLGLAKAGFVVQMVNGEAGCLDSHNIKRFGLRPFRSIKDFGPDKSRQIVADYLATCKRIGGTEFLWNDWCTHIANQYPTAFKSPYDVSLFHVVAIMEGM